MKEAYLHDLNPFLIKFTDEFGIRWYGLSYLAGFFIAYLIILWASKNGLSSLKTARVSDFVFSAALGCILGGRLGYVLFYNPSLFLSFSSDFPFWGAIAINEGGMASHGGMIGIVIACILFARKDGISPYHLFDLAALTAPIGIFFGRIANFINGELIGRAAGEAAWFKVKFPQDILSWPAYEPEKLLSLSSVVEKLGIDSTSWKELVTRAQFSDPYILNGTLERIITAVQNKNIVVQNSLGELLIARHPSQLYAAFSEGLLLFLFLAYLWRKPRRAGFITGIFFCGYAIVRVFGEFFRMPDAHIGYQIFELTRGQILSLFLFLGGVLVIRLSKSNLYLGGWGSKLITSAKIFY